MKKIYYLFFSTIFLLNIACNKDTEERVCVKSNFIGEFVGQTVCKSELGASGAPVASVIRVSSGSAENELTVDVGGFVLGVTIDGCTFLGLDKNSDVDVAFSGSLNGDILKVKLEGIAFNTFLDCETEGERN